MTGNVAMDPLHRIRSGERKHPREHLVQGDAQRVEIAAGVDRPVHAAGLLGRHVGEGAGDDVQGRGRLAFARQAGGHAEAGEPDIAGGVDQHACRLDVLMNEALPVDLAERSRE